jgi:hypothetical protein
MKLAHISELFPIPFTEAGRNSKRSKEIALNAFKALEDASTLEILAVFKDDAKLDLTKYRDALGTVFRICSVGLFDAISETGPVELEISEWVATGIGNNESVDVYTARNNLDPKRNHYSTQSDFRRDIIWEQVIGEIPPTLTEMYLMRQIPSKPYFTASESRQVLFAGDIILDSYPVIRTNRVEIIKMGTSNRGDRLRTNPIKQARPAFEMAHILA